MSLRHRKWVRNRFFFKLEIMLGGCISLTVLIWFLYMLHRELMNTQLPLGLK